MKQVCIFFLTLSSLSASAQVILRKGAAAPSAVLQVNDSTRGVLLPTMGSASLEAIPSPAEGLMVSDTTAGNRTGKPEDRVITFTTFAKAISKSRLPAYATSLYPIACRIDASGQVVSGKGFTATRSTTGQYQLCFHAAKLQAATAIGTREGKAGLLV